MNFPIIPFGNFLERQADALNGLAEVFASVGLYSWCLIHATNPVASLSPYFPLPVVLTLGITLDFRGHGTQSL